MLGYGGAIDGAATEAPALPVPRLPVPSVTAAEDIGADAEDSMAGAYEEAAKDEPAAGVGAATRAAWPLPAPILVMDAQPAPVAEPGVILVPEKVSAGAPAWLASGNTTSVLSVVEHRSLGMLATNMSGNLVQAAGIEAARLSLEEPPVTEMGAQTMYISRLPTLLNQVQAREYLPFGIPRGMAYE